MAIAESDRVSAGLTGLDEILHGGFISERTYTIRGDSGTGKTILGYHFLTQGVQAGETALYFAFEETAEDITANAAGLGFDLGEVIIEDMSPSAEQFLDDGTYTVFGPGEVEADSIVTQISEAVERHQPAVFGFVHGETSTGVRQTEIPELTRIAREHDAYVIADTVASLGGAEFHTDEWGLDVVYSGSQKCLSAPPGASPITFSDRAVEKIRGREEPVRSWYLDFEGIWEYWDDDPSYHHTGPISTTYALRESLRMVGEEGIERAGRRTDAPIGALVELS